MTRSVTINLQKKISAADYYGGNKHSERDNLKRDAQAMWAVSPHYRYLGAVNEQHILNRYIKTTRAAKKQIVPDEALMVLLGGPFQQVGEEHEAVGGDNQKVG